MTRPNRNSNGVRRKSGDGSLRVLLALNRLLDGVVVQDPHASSDSIQSVKGESEKERGQVERRRERSRSRRVNSPSPDPALLLGTMYHQASDDDEPAGDVLNEEELVVSISERTGGHNYHARNEKKRISGRDRVGEDDEVELTR